MPCHTSNMQMASLLCGSFHVSSNFFSCWMPCHTWNILTYGFSPVWVLLLVFKVLLWQKVLPHMVHLNGFSSVWVLTFLFELAVLTKALAHYEQGNCFSTVWVLLCINNAPLSLNALSHFGQANSFSGPFMYLECTTLFEWLVTLGADKWLLSCVGPFMHH